MNNKCIWIVMCMLLMLACSHDESVGDWNPGQASGHTTPPILDKSIVRFDCHEDTFSVNIVCSADWTIKIDSSWVSADKMSGRGNETVKFRCSKNLTVKQREAEIYITNTFTGKSAKVLVCQTGRPRGKAGLVSNRVVVGNAQTGEKTYIELTFDMPITVEAISSSRYYLSDITPEYSEDHCSVRFGMPVVTLGLESEGTITVVNGDGAETTTSFRLDFYDKHYKVEGQVRGAIVSSDEQSVWLSTSHPSKLIELSLVDGSVLHEIDMPFTPAKISINPYNGLLYVMPYNMFEDKGFANSFCTVNPQKGSITATYTIEPSAKTHPQYPVIYPYEVEFTSDGFGVLMLRSRETTQLEWRYIDSANDNKITATDYDWDTFWIEHVYQSCNQKSIYANGYYAVFSDLYQITRQQPVPQPHTLDTHFKNTNYWAGGNMTNMVFHRSRNRLFVSTAPYCQCVVNLDNDSYSEVFNAESRGAKAAWDYTDPSRNIIYFAGGIGSVFLVLDMDKPDCVYYQECIWGSDDICTIDHLATTNQVLITSLDGVYLLSLNHDK